LGSLVGIAVAVRHSISKSRNDALDLGMGEQSAKSGPVTNKGLGESRQR
jgi:hypothetical protein